MRAMVYLCWWNDSVEAVYAKEADALAWLDTFIEEAKKEMKRERGEKLSFTRNGYRAHASLGRYSRVEVEPRMLL